MTTLTSRSRTRQPRRRTVVVWVVGLLLVAVLFCVAWIAVRALQARDELIAASSVAHRMEATALSGNTASIQGDVAELQQHAAAAAGLTSDPIWRGAEVIPFVGDNLRVVRQTASLIDAVAVDALPSIGTLTQTLTIESLTPHDGAFDLSKFTTAQPLLATARAAIDTANTRALGLDTSKTLPQVQSAIGQLVTLVAESKTVIDGLDTMSSLLPPMLGASGTRSYLLLSLNNAELRATGGIASGPAVLSADNGKITLAPQEAATSLRKFDPPVLPVTASERALYGEGLATFLQDVNFTPDFARSGQLAQAMWKERTGHSVDGVIAIDPVALGYLMAATGPVTTKSGTTISSDTAAAILLSEVYSTIPSTENQDKFFAEVTSAVFTSITGGVANSKQLVAALLRSADERRIHLWSAHADEQKRIGEFPIANGLPAQSKTSAGFGVYFNDGTGAKMGYYVTANLGVSSQNCRVDRRTAYGVSATLSSNAPANAATALPEYVTGGGIYGVALGSVKTNVYVYAPPGARTTGVSIGGQPFAFVSGEENGQAVAGVEVTLAPGESARIDFSFIGGADAPTTVSLAHTPMASEPRVSLSPRAACGAPGGVSPSGGTGAQVSR